MQQEDVFFAQLTVKETLLFAVRLARSKGELDASDASRSDEEICTRLMTDLGLMKCAETKVGDARTRGVSGGEKKRLSLACHLVSSPKIIFLDEPTSGLDSFQALNVIKALKNLCERRNTTVVCSIHQPRQKIIDLFDDVTVLSSGKLMYHGSMGALEGHFEKLGHKCPKGHNILEFVIDLISIDASTPETMLESEWLIEEVAKSAYSSKSLSSSLSSSNTTNKAAAEGAPPRSVALLRRKRGQRPPLRAARPNGSTPTQSTERGIRRLNRRAPPQKRRLRRRPRNEWRACSRSTARAAKRR